MAITRKEFCTGLLGSGAALWLPGCGGGGYSGSPAPAPSPASCGATSITGNHGHTLSVPRADLDSAVDMSYSIAGSAGHDHMITLTVAQLRSLKTGGAVTVTSTTTNAHEHQVTASCP